jgi:hypothetical protein
MSDGTAKVFNVEGWGQVGMANLEAFVPFPGFKSHRDLEVNEVTEGKLQKPGSDHRPERITRIK